MPIEIIEESPNILSQYEKVPIAFRVETRFLVLPINNGLGGLTFTEETVTPYVKDYDAFEIERPSFWAKRFDISHWGIFAAFENGQRVGGAAVAWNTPEVEMLEGRKDLACLWDLRVHPDYRNSGVGRELFAHSLEWARRRSCRLFKVETQNINVPACRFYLRQGCELGAVNRFAYPESMNETQLIWYLKI